MNEIHFRENNLNNFCDAFDGAFDDNYRGRIRLYISSLSAWFTKPYRLIYYRPYDLYVADSLMESATINANVPSGCFSFCASLKNVELGNNVEEIGGDAFCNCTSLKSVKLGSNVKKIYNSAFNKCTLLESIEFPSNVEEIMNGAFYDCGLKSVSIPNNVVVIEDRAFYCCQNLRTATLPSAYRARINSLFGSYPNRDGYNQGLSNITFTFYD